MIYVRSDVLFYRIIFFILNLKKYIVVFFFRKLERYNFYVYLMCYLLSIIKFFFNKIEYNYLRVFEFLLG